MGASASKVKTAYEQALLPEIRSHLQQLFRSADSAILKMAEQATENSEQNRHFESAQSLRITHHDISRYFADHLLSPFAGVSAQPAANDEEHVNNLHKLLAVDVQADSENLAAGLSDLQQRLQNLDKNAVNPLAPASFVEGFLHGLAQADLDIHSKTLVLRLFEDQLYQKIDDYISQTNKALADSGVLPDLKTRRKAAPAPAARQKAPAIEEIDTPVANALVDLQANDYEHLEEKLAPRALLQWQNTGERDLCLEMERLKLLPQGQQSIKAEELEKIRQVKQLFSLVLADRNLPGIAKALLAQLQLPYTRVALSDPGFFNDEQNIAKSLLHEIIRLSASWEPEADALADDAFFQRQVETVTVFWEAERIAGVPFRDMLFDYLIYEEAQRQSDVLSSQRLMDSQSSAVHSEEVRQKVDAILQDKLAAAELPQAAQQIMNEGWSHVLYLYALNEGMDSEAWQQALAVVDELIATLQPGKAYTSRTDFLVKLPALLKSMREGLSAIELNPAQINDMLSALESEHKKTVAAIADSQIDEVALQKARIEASERQLVFSKPVRRQPPANDQAAQEPPPAASEEQPPEQPQTAQTEVAPEPEPAVSRQRQAAMAKLDSLGQGSWLLWHHDNEQQRCRLAAYIKHTRKFILTDRSGAKVAEFVYDDMLDMLESGRIEMIESEQIFERALESVIGGIREKR